MEINLKIWEIVTGIIEKRPCGLFCSVALHSPQLRLSQMATLGRVSCRTDCRYKPLLKSSSSSSPQNLICPLDSTVLPPVNNTYLRTPNTHHRHHHTIPRRDVFLTPHALLALYHQPTITLHPRLAADQRCQRRPTRVP